MNNRIQIIVVLVMCVALAYVWLRSDKPAGGSIEVADVAPGDVKRDALERDAMSGNLEARRKLCARWLGVASVTADYKSAVRWCEMAAQSGDMEAQLVMAKLYQLGRGVPADPQAAKGWYEKAAAQGNSSAKQELEKLGAGEPPRS